MLLLFLITPKKISDLNKKNFLIINLSGSLTLVLIGFILFCNSLILSDNRALKFFAPYFILLGLVKLIPSKTSFTDGNALITLLNDKKFEKYQDKFLYDWYQYHPRTKITDSDFEYLLNYFANKPNKLDKFTAKYLLADTTIKNNKEKFKMYFVDCKITSSSLTYQNLTQSEVKRLFNLRNNLRKFQIEYNECYNEILLENLSNLPPIELFIYYLNR